jgi:CRISPR/Cas system-associated protein Csm6
LNRQRINKNMNVQKKRKNKSEDILESFFNEAIKRTNFKLKTYLDELKKLKEETTVSPK